jgi:hypothetical protein
MSQLKIKVIPGASSSAISGWLGDALKIRVTAPPEKGKANTLVESIICTALGLTKNEVHIVAGKTSPNKVVEITGLTQDDIFNRIEKQLT